MKSGWVFVAAILTGVMVVAAPAAAQIVTSTAGIITSTGTIQPYFANQGGSTITITTTLDNLNDSVGEPVISSVTFTSYVLYPGLLSLMSSPGPVENLSVLSVSSEAAALNWSAPGYDGELGALQPGTSYYIQFASATPVSWSFSNAQVIISTQGVNPGDSQTTNVAGLFANTTYYYSLWTLDARGDLSALSNQTTAATLTKAPLTVATTFYMVGGSSVTAQWAALAASPSSATCEGYELDASSTDFNGAGNIYSSTTTLASVSALTVSGLGAATLYYFRVGSLNWSGVPDYTVLGSTKTILTAVPPGPGSPLFTNISSDSITANWASGNPAGTIYTLQSSTASNFSGNLASSDTYALSAATATLNPDTTYYFEVDAATGSSVSVFTILGGTATLSAPPGAVVPAFLSVSSSALSFEWSANGNPLGSAYSVVASTEDDYPNADSGDVSLATAPAGSSPSADLSGLAPNTTYFVFAAGINWNGVSGDYVFLGSTATLAALPSSAVSTFSAVAVDGFTVSWNANGNPLSSTTYTVQASTDPNFGASAPPYQVSFTTAPFGDNPSATFGPGALNANTTYYFGVQAVNADGVATAFVDLGSTSTLALAPASLDFNPVASNSIQLNWSGGTNGPNTEYTANVSTDPSFGNGAVVTTAAIFTDFVSSSDILPNTTYYFQAAAINNNGIGTAFVSAATATLAALPESAASTFSAVAADGFTVSWNAEGNPLSTTTYTVQVSTDPNFGASGPPYQVSFTTAPTAGPSATFGPNGIGGALNSDTTYYFSVQAVNVDGVATTFADLGSTVTLAAAPGSPQISAIYLSSAVISWTPTTSQGYQVQASSTDFGAVSPGGTVYSSTTDDETMTSLSVLGLGANTTYYFVVGAYASGGGQTQAPAGSTSTFAEAPSGAKIFQVASTSVTANWLALPATPQSATSEGYELDAATAPATGGNSDFTGDIISSISYSVLPSTLSVQDLNPGTTYTLRVGALNWDGVPNYSIIASTLTPIVPFNWIGPSGNWYTKTDWSPAGIPGAGSPVTIDRAVTVTVSASSPTITFYSLTLGDSTGIIANLTLSTAASGIAISTPPGNIVIYPQSGLTINTSAQLDLSGDFIMYPGSSMTETIPSSGAYIAQINLNVGGTFDLQAGSTISVSSAGYTGAHREAPGNGPGYGAKASKAASGGGGAGHGGPGGDGVASTANGGATYDSPSNPAEPGSGGGGDDSGTGDGTGGTGGGLVIINASSMSIDGEIIADGTAGGGTTYGGGGGSGGSINLTANYFDGGGVLLSTGGAQGGTGTDKGGEGGGGLIAIDVTQSGVVCGISYSVAGGSGTNAGIYTTNNTIEAPTNFESVSASSYSITWQWNSTPYATNYQVFASSPNGQPIESAALGAAATSDAMTGLQANTTYTAYVQASGCGATANSTSQSLATLTGPIAPISPAFVSAFTNSIEAQWTALPSAPSSATAEGYELEASSTDFGAGVVYSSSSGNSQDNVLAASGLDPNTSYYFQVAGINWAGAVGPFTELGSTSTLAVYPSVAAIPFADVGYSSAALTWTELPSSPLSASAEGYELDASTAPDFSGVVFSSATNSVADSTLAITGLNLSNTYYFQLGSRNWNNSMNYENLGPLEMQVNISSSGIDLGNFDADLYVSTVSVSSIVVTNAGNIPMTFTVWGATATPGTPWSLGTSSGIDIVLLQGLWNPTQPSGGDFQTPITGSTTTLTGGGGCADVPAGDDCTMWFQFWRPTSISSSTIGVPQSFHISVAPIYP